MASPLESLIASGTRLWLDSIDPDLVIRSRAMGATGATSNPVIVSDLIRSGRFDRELERLVRGDLSDAEVAWQLTDELVREAQSVFLPIWQATGGDDGFVSFELDPLLEDPDIDLPHKERVEAYIEEGKRWSAGHENRMIKVPATPAGLDALESLVASGVTVNVTLIFSDRQYREARSAIWHGAQQRRSRARFKSVYSIFVSRVDVYTSQYVPELSRAAQGMVGIVIAKRIWGENRQFWSDKGLPLAQEIIFASTGTKMPQDPPWKYVAAFAGNDIETNPPATNDAVQQSGRNFTRQVDQLPSSEVLDEIDCNVDLDHLERTLMVEGIRKFADPHKALLALVAEKRTLLTAAS